MKNFTKPITEGYSFDMNAYFKGAWRTLNAKMGAYVGVTILFVLISVIISFVPLLNIVSGFIQTLLTAGFFIYAAKQKTNSAQFSDFFGGFQFALPIFLYSIVYLIILIPGFALLFGFVFPFSEVYELISSGSVRSEDYAELFTATLSNITSPASIAAIILATVYLFYFSISYLLILPLITVGKLEFWPAMEVSRKTIGKNIVPVIGMFILLGIGVGAFVIVTCGVGLLFAFPFIYLVYFEMYDQIFTYDTAVEFEDTEGIEGNSTNT